MGIPTVEKPPSDLHSPWMDIWRGALREMKEMGTWTPTQKPLLDAYVYALRAESEHREIAQANPFSHSHATDRDFVHPGFTSADRERKAAVSLADALGLTARSRKALNLKSGDKDGGEIDPFGALDDEVAAKRKAKAG